jgi:RNA polymerase sigma factor (sigma-70 family)
MFILQPKPDQPTKFEDVLLGFYPRLIEWALQLTRRDRAQAEDLVQELFVRFARLSTPPEQIQNIENYLFLVIRNLHYAQLRRAKTSAIDALAIVGEESLERGLRASDQNELISVRADLGRICEYFCKRKNTSRSASILLLRYFHGYFPSEVIKLLQITSIALRKGIQAARREAHLGLDSSETSLKATAEMTPISISFTTDPQQVFLLLRARIFASCVGQCFSPAFLKQQYADPDNAFSTEELAHLVSCRICLDLANTTLGLPPLAERSPDETVGRDTPQGPDNNASGGTGEDSCNSGKPVLVSGRNEKTTSNFARIRRKLRYRVQEALEHVPQRLFIAVNGEVRASQRVTAPVSELQVELDRRDMPTYIEVLSEQHICIAFMLVQSPNLDQALNQMSEMPLSEDRSIRVVLSFATSSPTIVVVYLDPLAGLQIEEDEPAVDAAQNNPIRQPGNHSLLHLPVSRRFAMLFSKIGSRLLRVFSTMNPLFATAVVIVLASIFFVCYMRSGSRISVETLLNRAEQSDIAVIRSMQPEVIYQNVRITAPGRTTERSLYRDPQGKHRPKQQHLNTTDRQLRDQMALGEVSWDDPLSAANYRAWHDRQPIKQDIVSRTGENLLTVTTTTNRLGSVLKESLTVRESDFHPVDRTIELRDQGTIEIAELNYDVLPWGAVNQEWFEPILGNTNVNGAGILPIFAVHGSRTLSIRELNKTELEVRYLLHKAGADLGDPIDLRINNENSPPVSVVGIVQSESQKQELTAQLRQIPHVGIRLQTEEEAAQITLRNQPETVKRAEPELVSEHSPIEKQLLNHFGDPSAVESFSSHATTTADNLVAHAWAIRRLADRYGPPGSAKEQALDPISLHLLQTIRRDHLRAMADATAELSALLGPVLTSIAEPYETPASERPPLEIAEEVRSLTVGLLSGTEATEPTENENPRQAAETLLAALHRLTAILKEQP